MTLSLTADKSLLDYDTPNSEWDTSEGMITRLDVLYNLDTGITPYSVVRLDNLPNSYINTDAFV